jgi:hypothetical protein
VVLKVVGIATRYESVLPEQDRTVSSLVNDEIRPDRPARRAVRTSYQVSRSLDR